MSYTSATEPHPRASLRNKNLPKLPEFEFPARAPSPQPQSPAQPRRSAPSPPHTPYTTPPSPPRSLTHPSSLVAQIEAQLDREIEETKRQQYPQAKGTQAKGSGGSQTANEQTEGVDKTEAEMAISDMSKKGQWIFYAITSGACAAVNGVFAKLCVFLTWVESIGRPAGFRYNTEDTAERHRYHGRSIESGCANSDGAGLPLRLPRTSRRSSPT